MNIKDAFDKVLYGFNLPYSLEEEEDKSTKNFNTLKKDSIQYCNIIEKKLVHDKWYYTSEIEERHFMQPRDILIFLKKPYRVGTYTFSKNLEVIVPNNFIILRGINMDRYSYIFVANYLEKIGIKEIVSNKKEKKNYNDNLTIGDIEDFELPDIPKDLQMSITPLLQAINERSATYSNILENDEKIAMKALKKIVGEDND